MVCTFFGHRDTPAEIEPILHSALKELIEKKHIDCFYVGNNGNFDNMVRRQLKTLKTDFPHIEYAVVLAYRPIDAQKNIYEDYSDTIYPDILVNTPPQYAVIKRNHWMISKADHVITYVNYPFGGAAKFKEVCERKGKIVINLANRILQ